MCCIKSWENGKYLTLRYELAIAFCNFNRLYNLHIFLQLGDSLDEFEMDDSAMEEEDNGSENQNAEIDKKSFSVHEKVVQLVERITGSLSPR